MYDVCLYKAEGVSFIYFLSAKVKGGIVLEFYKLTINKENLIS